MGQRLNALGKMTAAVLKTLMAPQVGREDICDSIGYIENAGTPGAVVPDFIGQALFDTTGLDWYRAYGVAAGEWAPAGINTETLTELLVLDGAIAGTSVASKAAVFDAAIGLGAFRETGRNLRKQAAPAAKTVSVTLTAAEIMAGLITGNQGAAGAAVYTMPLATDLETALLAVYPGLAVDDSFDFSIINISAVAAETVTLATNTGHTMVGDLSMACIAVGDQSSGTFRVWRTAANTYSVYRI